MILEIFGPFLCGLYLFADLRHMLHDVSGDICRYRTELVRLGFACLLYLSSQEGGLILDCSKLDRDGRKMEEYNIGYLYRLFVVNGVGMVGIIVPLPPQK